MSDNVTMLEFKSPKKNNYWDLLPNADEVTRLKNIKDFLSAPSNNLGLKEITEIQITWGDKITYSYRLTEFIKPRCDCCGQQLPEE